MYDEFCINELNYCVFKTGINFILRLFDKTNKITLLCKTIIQIVVFPVQGFIVDLLETLKDQSY